MQIARIREVLIRLFVLINAGCLSTSAGAHDFWMQASTYYPQPGERVNISLHVGVDLVGDSLPNIPDWYQDFSYFDGEARHKVKGDTGDDPAGYFNAGKRGTQVVGYHSKPEFVELKPAKFDAYLKEEGLEKIISRRRKLNESNSNAREYYIRCVKMLVQTGESAEGYDQTLDYTLELFPQQNPYELKVGDRLPIKLRYKNRPLKDALVIAFSRQQPQIKQKIRTNSEGLAIVELNNAGEWIIKAVEMERYQKEDAEWISYWSSLTFELKQ